MSSDQIAGHGWKPIDVAAGFAARAPGPASIAGRYIMLEPLSEDHADSLFAALQDEDQDVLQRYTADPVCASVEELHSLIKAKRLTENAGYFACIDHFAGKTLGFGALMRADRTNRVIELGNLLFSDGLRHKRTGTEAVYLLLRHAFEDLGYRRVEWKCNSLNRASRNAALRYGFSFEGVFRQHMIVKGCNRDTAWFSMLDSEWGQRREALETWLQPDNFDAYGTQFTSLSQMNGVGGS
ncbi:MAG: GNAT family N-acetyltransferase [Hyphomicrobiales bacterium]|nr:GNAT family N-acetyltransferase [Hyphomicrobiales bacterium]